MNHTTTTLNRLIETCIDGAQGYYQAAKIVKNKHYKRLFRSFAQQREDFAYTLQGMVARRGVMPSANATPLLAATHRGWMTLRAAADSGQPASILAECKRGEQIAIANYRNAIKADLPVDIQPTIKNQYQHIRSVYERVHALHDVMPFNRTLGSA